MAAEHVCILDVCDLYHPPTLVLTFIHLQVTIDDSDEDVPVMKATRAPQRYVCVSPVLLCSLLKGDKDVVTGYIFFPFPSNLY